ncbi:MAG: hypothetical protein PHI22_01985 [Bacilli bacterium]|nr:hypothetical protein [Bacilli bacterium]MDD4643714.1 hypothetical protein [Bacilli bacterium]
MLKDIIEGYKKQAGDDLKDLNEKQLNIIAALAYEEGHSAGVDECISYMYDYVSLVRDVLAAI